MNAMTDNGHVCDACGRSFPGIGALNYHLRSCRPGKRRLEGALSKVHQVWQNKIAMRKRRKLNMHPDQHPTLISIDSAFQRHVTTPDNPVVEHAEIDQQAAVHQLQVLSEGSSVALQGRVHVPIMPQLIVDILPQPPPPLLPQLDPYETSDSVIKTYKTSRNIFGLIKTYNSTRSPTHDPDQQLALDNLNDCAIEVESSLRTPSPRNTFHPYPNESSFLLGDWYWNRGTQKSQSSFKHLVDIITAVDFKAEDVRNTSWSAVNKRLGESQFDENMGEWEDEDAGWLKTRVSINVPFHSRMKDKGGTRVQVVGDLYHRSIVAVIKEKLANPSDSQLFHFEPYELSWVPTLGSDAIHIHGELYTSPSFIDAHQKLQESPREPGCNLPRLVAGLMLWSDATHLTSFGNAKLWPLYLYFGNESKYRRHKPSCHLANHVAYFRMLPDSFKDFATKHVGRGPTRQFMTYCNREAFHAQLSLIFDDEFIEAYIHGIVIICSDGITRRFYPRLFTHSADYPEKILLASIRQRGFCPCPRCLVKKTQLQHMGTEQDMRQRKTEVRRDDEDRKRRVSQARDLIYVNKIAVSGKAVEELLKYDSLTPISNAFSSKLGPLNFDLFPIFVVDLMHEFELGVWKAVLIHLIRMLHATSSGVVNEMDRRYRQVPTFGRDTIRKFSSNTSELKRLAARDYEDLLQCSLPVFDGLFPEPYNKAVMDLLFLCSHWHGLAKLRMHTDQTLELLDEVTISLGAQFRYFVNTICPDFKTRELPREALARARRAKKPATAVVPIPHAFPPAFGNIPTEMFIPSEHQLDGLLSMPEIPSSAAPVTHTPHTHPIMSANSSTYVVDHIPPNAVVTNPNSPFSNVNFSTSGHIPLRLLALSPPESSEIMGRVSIMADVSAPNVQPPVPNTTAQVSTAQAQTPKARRFKGLNLNTYKYHSLGDYADMIRKYGTTDSYSTELGELEHRTAKSWYPRTDKKDYEKQMARIERRQKRIRGIRARHFPNGTFETARGTSAATPDSHYSIGKTENFPEHVGHFVKSFPNDPAIKDFIPRLKEHLLHRITNLLAGNSQDNTTNSEIHPDWENVLLKNDRIYTHKIMRVHYTSYDVRRGEDVVHTGSSHCNIMVLNPQFRVKNLESHHPFWYARVIGIYHTNVIYIGKENADYQPRRLDFLWVRWYHFNGSPAGWRQQRLDKLYFPPVAGEGSFSFLDPDCVLRSAHIIPFLSGGKVYDDEKGTSPCAQDGADWKFYAINRFVDRDMIMRHYWGLGVGHTYARISAADARALHITTDHQSGEHINLLPEGAEDQPEDVDEDSDLGDDDMVYAHDDRWSDSSGGSDAEFEARYDVYGI